MKKEDTAFIKTLRLIKKSVDNFEVGEKIYARTVGIDNSDLRVAGIDRGHFENVLLPELKQRGFITDFVFFTTAQLMSEKLMPLADQVGPCTVSLSKNFLELANDVLSGAAPDTSPAGQGKVLFEEAKGQLIFGDRVIQLPRDMNEHELCKVMFKKVIDVAVTWDVVYSEMYGSDPTDTKKNHAAIKDSANALRKRLLREGISDRPLVWKNNSVIRKM